MNKLITILIMSYFCVINTVLAQEIGLLIGVRQGGNYDTTAQLSNEEGPIEEKTEEMAPGAADYRTLWFRISEDQTMELEAEKTSLLAPREDGFWRIDVKHSVYNDFTEDFIWVNPAPDPDMPPNPFLANKLGIDAFEVALLLKEQGISARQGEYCIGHTSRDILFVGTDHLSVGMITSETCRGTGATTGDSRLKLLTLDELEPVELSELLAEDAQTTFMNTAQEYKEQHQSSGSEQWGEVSGGIVRGAGHWQVKGHFPGPKNYYTNFEVPIAAPETLTETQSLELDWQTITEQVPEAIDALMSPDNQILIVLTPSSLLGFSLNDGKLSQAPIGYYVFKNPLSVVMVRWTEGQYVNNWSQEIANLGPQPDKKWLKAGKIETQKTAAEDSFKLFGVVLPDNQAITLNIRADLGEHTQLIAELRKDTQVQILDILGQWYKVQLDDGQVGYAQSQYIKILPKLPHIQTSSCPTEQCNYGENWTLKTAATLYAGPSITAPVITQLAAGQMVKALGGQLRAAQYSDIKVIQNTQVAALPVDAPSVDAKETLDLKTGEHLFGLEHKGEGVHVVWYQGRLYYIDDGWNADKGSDVWGELLVENQTDWWVEVSVPEQNFNGWISNPQVG